MNKYKAYFLIGSSGSGKTTALESIETMNLPNFSFYFPDREKIPSLEEMVKEYGSTDEWQKRHTLKSIEKIKEHLEHGNVVIDTQSRPSFIKEGCQQLGEDLCEIILFDCTDEVRKERLMQRGHLELANEQMMNWAKFLREACKKENCRIIDNTNLTKEQSKEMLLSVLNEKEN